MGSFTIWSPHTTNSNCSSRRRRETVRAHTAHVVSPRKLSTVAVSSLLAACLIKGQLACWVQKKYKHIKSECHSIAPESFVDVGHCAFLCEPAISDNEVPLIWLLGAFHFSCFKIGLLKRIICRLSYRSSSHNLTRPPVIFVRAFASQWARLGWGRHLWLCPMWGWWRRHLRGHH